MINGKYFLTRSNLAHLDPFFKLFGVRSDSLTKKSSDFLELVKDRIQLIYPDLDIELINLSELQEELIKLIENEVNLFDYFVISLEEDWVSKAGVKLEICRAEDSLGKSAGYCARPGFDSPDEQIKRAAQMSGDKKILITDDGLFSGKTVKWVIEKLRNCGKNQFLVYVLVATEEATQSFKRDKIDVHSLRSLDIPKDWVCERDLRYCIARTGKPVVSKKGELLSIEHEGNRVFFSRPYPKPTGNLNSAASIPEEHVQDFSRFVLEWHIELFSELEGLAGTVKLGDLAKLSTLHSVPFTGELPDLEMSVTEYLRTLLNYL